MLSEGEFDRWIDALVLYLRRVQALNRHVDDGGAGVFDGGGVEYASEATRVVESGGGSVEGGFTRPRATLHHLPIAAPSPRGSEPPANRRTEVTRPSVS